jgi:hypothetical protein
MRVFTIYLGAALFAPVGCLTPGKKQKKESQHLDGVQG